jgi:hypothetical protein
MMSQKNLNSRCNARAKSGKPCGAAATPGGLCFFHANPKKASELGRIGGRSNRHAAGETVDPLPTLDTALAVRDTVARLIVNFRRACVLLCGTATDSQGAFSQISFRAF